MDRKLPRSIALLAVLLIPELCNGQNDLEALRQAAERGEAQAQLAYGFCYFHGKGVPQDYAKAVAWYRKAAEQGESDAQFKLGSCYSLGISVPTNTVVAASWYRKAAEQGHTDAQGLLGVCYYSGDGVPKDRVEGYKWLILATAKKNTKDFVEMRDKIMTRLTPQQIAEGKRRAAEFAVKIFTRK